MKKILLGVFLLTGLTGILFLASCAGGVSEDRVADIEGQISDIENQIGKVSEPVTERHFYITGVEWKGTTSADSLDPPSVNPATLSNGYGFKPVGFDDANPQNWRVSAYVWTPASMIAFEGDTITLTIFIINGNEHNTWVRGPDGGIAASDIEMQRGREYTMTFVADEPGTYILTCDEHDPTMTAYIQVLPRS